MTKLRPNDQRARLAIIFFIISIIIEVASFLSDYVEYTFMEKFSNGIEVSDEKIELLEIIQSILAIGYLIIFILLIKKDKKLILKLSRCN